MQSSYTRVCRAGGDASPAAARLSGEEMQTIRRVEQAFSQLLREAAAGRKFGQFGVIVSLQQGAVKTFQTQACETLK